MKRTFQAFVVLAALGFAALLFAQSPAPPPGPPEDTAWFHDEADPQIRGPMGRRGGFGQGPRMGRGLDFGSLMGLRGEIRERLGLTDEQTAKLEQRNLDFAKARIRQEADVHVKRLELAELLRADTPDRTAIDRKLREVTEAQFAHQKAGIDHLLALRDILTPDQRQKLRTLPQELRRERMQRRMEPGHHPQGPEFGPHGPRRMQPPQPPQPE